MCRVEPKVATGNPPRVGSKKLEAATRVAASGAGNTGAKSIEREVNAGRIQRRVMTAVAALPDQRADARAD